jgi:SAM-dependent methyltransferase
LTQQLEAPARADYGIDAPGVIRNLIIASVAALVVWASAALGLWSGVWSLSLGAIALEFALARIGLIVAVICILMATWMLWDSKIGKLRSREKLLDFIPWTGRERVLDVGCGRGLMLIGAARRLPDGRAIGIDVWQSADLSGNRIESTLDNVRREGVADRVEVRTADMRNMPFPDESFDVIVSRFAIHNLYDGADRARAIAEIARVLKPGGRVVIDDIRHLREYAAHFVKLGITEIRHEGSIVIAALLAVITFGALRPGALIAGKPIRASQSC